MTVTIDGSASVTINSGAVLGINSATAVASTSGTSIDFTSIPSYVKRITVMFSGVSFSGGAELLVQLGTGAGPTYTTSGYVSASGRYTYTSSTGGSNSTAGLHIAIATATGNPSGSMTIHNITGNTWVGNHVCGSTGNSAILSGGGSIALAALLTAIRITSTSTDTFDAGTINILYE